MILGIVLFLFLLGRGSSVCSCLLLDGLGLVPSKGLKLGNTIHRFLALELSDHSPSNAQHHNKDL